MYYSVTAPRSPASLLMRAARSFGKRSPGSGTFATKLQKASYVTDTPAHRKALWEVQFLLPGKCSAARGLLDVVVPC